MTVYDCFIAQDEIEAIRARCCELPDAVHIAVTGTYTFRGDPKPEHLAGLDLPRFRVHAIRPAQKRDPWENERTQRDAILWLLATFYRPALDDLVIVGDADEIPRGTAIPNVLEATVDGPVRLAMRMHYYTAAWTQPGGVAATVAFRWVDRPTSLTDMRRDGTIPAVNGAGWHLSYWGGTDRIRHKLTSFAHHEYDLPLVHAQVPSMIARGIHINGVQLEPWDGSDMPCGL